jgi:anti-sigma factor RsiW
MDRLDCTEALRLIDAAVDDELDLLSRMSFDAHLVDCPDCAAALGTRQELVGQVRRHAERFTTPDQVRRRVLAALPADVAPGPVHALPARRRWLNGGAWAASAMALAASLVLFLATPGQQDTLSRDLVTAQIRSLMPDHLTDVPSSDQHTVKPWFNGRVALSPPAPNLAEDGFPLIGGRLDYVDQHTAAVLVYGRSKHIINLFIWAVPGAPDHALRADNRNGYNLLEWTQAGIAYAAVSDVNRADLDAFQHLWLARAADETPKGQPPAPR